MAEERPSGQDQEPDVPSLAQASGQFLGYGLQWALATGLFLTLGWFADGWLGTKPLFTIAGAFIGAGAGFYSLYFHLVVEPRQRKSRHAPPRDRP